MFLKYTTYINMQERIEADLYKYTAEYRSVAQAFVSNSSNPQKSLILKLLCTLVPQFIQADKTSFDLDPTELLTVGMFGYSNFFESPKNYTYLTNETMLKPENASNFFFFTLLGNIVQYVELKTLAGNSTNDLVSYLFGPTFVPTLPIIMRHSVVDTCYRFFEAIKNRRPEDVEEATQHLLPLLKKEDFNLFVTATQNYINLSQKCFKFRGRVKLSPQQTLEQKFDCLLAQKKCKADDCYMWVDIGLPYCDEHLKQILHVEIKESTIPNAGLGVFAYQPDVTKRNKPVFSPKKFSNLIYEGDVLTEAQLNDRYGAGETFSGPYILQSNKKFVDSSCNRGVVSMINHTLTPAEKNIIRYQERRLPKAQRNPHARIKSPEANAEFATFNIKGVTSLTRAFKQKYHGKGYVKIIKNIYHGKEIFVSYGIDFFKPMPNVTEIHETKDCL